MAKAIETYETYTADYTSQVHYARSASGAVFTRMQYRDTCYGYKWTAWRETVAEALEGLRNLGPKGWRLPA